MELIFVPVTNKWAQDKCVVNAGGSETIHDCHNCIEQRKETHINNIHFPNSFHVAYCIAPLVIALNTACHSTFNKNIHFFCCEVKLHKTNRRTSKINYLSRHAAVLASP